MFENITRLTFISVFYVREEEESEEEEEEEKAEADGKKADEGTSQDYPMARYDRNYHPCCLYMHFYNDCLCLLVSCKLQKGCLTCIQCTCSKARRMSILLSIDCFVRLIADDSYVTG